MSHSFTDSELKQIAVKVKLGAHQMFIEPPLDNSISTAMHHSVAPLMIDLGDLLWSGAAMNKKSLWVSLHGRLGGMSLATFKKKIENLELVKVLEVYKRGEGSHLGGTLRDAMVRLSSDFEFRYECYRKVIKLHDDLFDPEIGEVPQSLPSKLSVEDDYGRLISVTAFDAYQQILTRVLSEIRRDSTG